jgi:hypothetical protein
MDKEYTREVHVEIGGETRRVLLCLWGLVLAEERGFDVTNIDIDEESAEERSGDMRQMLDLLWVGMLPFDEDLGKKDLAMQISFGDLEDVTAAFNKVISRQLTDEVKQKMEAEAHENGEAAASEDGQGKSTETSTETASA